MLTGLNRQEHTYGHTHTQASLNHSLVTVHMGETKDASNVCGYLSGATFDILVYTFHLLMRSGGAKDATDKS